MRNKTTSKYTGDISDTGGIDYTEKISLLWKEELEPLSNPDDSYPMTPTEHIRLLHDRCDALLRRLEEHERVMLDIMKVR